MPKKTSKSAPGFLLVDNSNTWTKISRLSGGKISPPVRLRTSTLTAEALKKLDDGTRRILICSVVPKCRPVFAKAWGKRVSFIDWKRLPGVTVRYPHPETIGADRLANAVACTAYPLPAVVIDLGTAVTFDIISAKAEYVGGVIAPGLDAFVEYLHERTALLPKITIKKPRSPIGKSTVEAMRIGALYGYAGLVREILGRIRKELGARKLTVIATGGDAKLLASEVPEIGHVDPLFTLRGLKIIAEHLP